MSSTNLGWTNNEKSRVPECAAGTKPDNLEVCKKFLVAQMSARGLGYLSHEEFNERTMEATAGAGGDWQRFLAAKRAQAELKRKETSSLADDFDGAGFGSPMKGFRVKSEAVDGGISGKKKQEMLEVDDFGEPRFLDPMSEVDGKAGPEVAEKHRARYVLWAIAAVMFALHPELLSSVGNFYVLFTNIDAMSGTSVEQKAHAALLALSSLAKISTAPMADYLASVSKIRSTMALLPVEYRVSAPLFLLCVIKGVEKDSAYALVTDWIRRQGGLSLDGVITELAGAAVGVEDRQGKAPGMKVFHGAVQDHHTGGKRVQQICFNFRDTGSCSWGSRCRFSHDVTREAGGKAAQPAGGNKAKGTCFECRGPHDVDDCPKFKDRIAGLHKAQLKAMVAMMPAPAVVPPPLAAPTAAQSAAAFAALRQVGLDPTLVAAIAHLPLGGAETP
jgi:hypothetical protein